MSKVVIDELNRYRCTACNIMLGQDRQLVEMHLLNHNLEDIKKSLDDLWNKLNDIYHRIPSRPIRG